MDTNRDTPTELRFQRHINETALNSPRNGEGVRTSRPFRLSPAAYHNNTTDKSLKWSLYDRIKSLSNLLT